MLTRENFTSNHINQVKDNKKVDPAILERSIFALGLLETLVKVQLPFIFRGGTCIILVLDQPKRLSTDVDIVVAPGTDVSAYLERASKIYPFKKVSENERKAKGKIIKKHYIFSFYSERLDDDLEILLDVLFEENHYSKVIEKEIQTDILITEGENLKVKLPSPDCLLGDKLTAFAPHTTGISIADGRTLDIIKQLYDVATLADKYDNFEDLNKTFIETAYSEISYRELDIKPHDVLLDIIDTSVCIASRGTVNSSEYNVYKEGIKGLVTHTYDGLFSGEIAAVMACRVLYIATCLLKQKEIKTITDGTPFIKENLSNTKFEKLSYMRKVNQKAFAYIVLAAKLLDN